MKVVVTGATGLIGKELMRQLSSQINVLGLSRGNADGNLRKTDYSVEDLTAAFEGAEIVVHLAAIRGKGSDYQQFSDNAVLTENVLKAAVKAKVKKVIFMSSIAVYADVNNVPWKEDQLLRPQTFYGLSKIVGEHLCELYSEKGIAYTIFRCGIVLGITNNKRMTDVFIQNAAEKKPVMVKGKSIARRDFIYLKDVIDALCWGILKDQSKNQVYNLGSGHSYTNLEIALETNRAFDNVDNLIYLDNCEEGLKDSRMDSSKLAQAGFQSGYSLAEALVDIRSDWDGRKACFTEE